MRLFGSERIASVMDRLGAEEGEVIEHRMVTRSIERAQKKVEARNFEMRKHLLDYDDVMNQQRQVIYNRRRDVLERDSVRDRVLEIIEETTEAMVASHVPEEAHPQEWLWEDLAEDFSSTFFVSFPIEGEERGHIAREEICQRLVESVKTAYEQRVELVGEETFRQVEKAILLHTVDTCWQEHLYEMDELKEGVGFVGVGGKNPLIEYKKGAFDMFESLIARIDQETLRNLFQLRVDGERGPDGGATDGRGSRYSSIHRESTNLGFSGAPGDRQAGASGDDLLLGRPRDRSPRDRGLVAGGSEGTDGPAPREPVRVGPKIGRNAPCPCGSGKKYKRCHGRDA